ncbi:hypothetical protein FGB62_297g06 [Gracilaria domingensis]|nr:hypothetical protein FGB62_297g06 [Gracilaria domingensis]
MPPGLAAPPPPSPPGPVELEPPAPPAPPTRPLPPAPPIPARTSGAAVVGRCAHSTIAASSSNDRRGCIVGAGWRVGGVGAAKVEGVKGGEREAGEEGRIGARQRLSRDVSDRTHGGHRIAAARGAARRRRLKGALPRS